MAFNWLTEVRKQLDNLIIKDGGRLTVGDDGNLAYGREYWDDLRFPASAINPPGAASDPDVDTTYGWLLFDGGKTEVIFTLAQLPHSYFPGTPLSPHVHWCKTTAASGTVKWQLDYRWVRVGEVMDGAWATLSEDTPVISDQDDQYRHALTSFADIVSPSQLSDMLVFKLSRLGGSDTYGADAALLEFDVHYRLGQPGSRAEFSY